MRAVIYTRVSNDHSGRSTSTADQERECRTVCDQHGWSVAHVLTDDDRGASRWSSKDRPAYRQLADTLQRGDVLVTWEASRAQRDLAAYVQLRDLCAELGVQWCYSGRLHDLTSGDDRFTTGLDALLAEKEAEQIRDRVLRGKRASALAGKPHGRAPYGYRPVRDLTTGRTITWEPDPDRAPIVQEAVHRVLGGEPLHAICRDFTARGVPGNSGVWVRARLRTMLSTPSYAGLRTHRGDVVGEASWPALISVEDHRALLALFADPARRHATEWGVKHLLSGIAVCGECGSTVRFFGPRSLKSPTYLCEQGSCVRRRAEFVDDLVTETVLGYLESVHPDVFVGADEESAAAAREARDLQARLDAFTDQAADGGLSAAALARVEARLLPQIRAAQRRAARVPSPTLAAVVGPDARAVWDEMDLVARRGVIRATAAVAIHRSSVGTRRWSPDDIQFKWLI